MRFIRLQTLLFIFLAIQGFAKGQINVNDIDSLVARLSWKSVSMACNATRLRLVHRLCCRKNNYLFLPALTRMVFLKYPKLKYWKRALPGKSLF